MFRLILKINIFSVTFLNGTGPSVRQPLDELRGPLVGREVDGRPAKGFVLKEKSGNDMERHGKKYQLFIHIHLYSCIKYIDKKKCPKVLQGPLNTRSLVLSRISPCSTTSFFDVHLPLALPMREPIAHSFGSLFLEQIPPQWLSTENQPTHCFFVAFFQVFFLLQNVRTCRKCKKVVSFAHLSLPFPVLF